MLTPAQGLRTLAAPALLWVAGAFLAPMAVVAAISFWQVRDYALVPDLTAANYAKLAQPLYLGIFGRTLRVAITATVLSALIGYPVAYLLALRVQRFRFLLLTLVVLPLWTSYLVRSFAWMLILGTNGVVNYALTNAGLLSKPLPWLLYSEFAVIIALVHIYIPYFILPVYAVLDRLDRRLLEASSDLGASRFQTFWRVTLPLSLPGIASGAVFVFVPAVGAYVTPEILGGPNATMIGSVIAQQFGLDYQYPFGSALTMGVMGVIVAVTALILRAGRYARS